MKRIINICACIGLLLQPFFLDAVQRRRVNPTGPLPAMHVASEGLSELESVKNTQDHVLSDSTEPETAVSDRDIPEKERLEETIKTDLAPEKKGFLVTMYQKLPSFKLTYKGAVELLKQKAMCLYDYEHCTKRDMLAISYALGFLSGYGISISESAYFYTMRKMYATDLGRKIFSVQKVMDDFIKGFIGEYGLRVLYMEFFSNLIAPYLPSNIFTVGSFDPFTRIIRAPHLFSMVVAGNWEGLKKAEMEAFKNIALLRIPDSVPLEPSKSNIEKLFQIYLYIQHIYSFFSILISSLVGITNEIKYATTIAGNNQSLLKNVWYYLKMNVKCIWNETYCETKNEKWRAIAQQAAQYDIPHGLAFNRRLGLFGMMGFTSGIVAHAIQAKQFDFSVPQKPGVQIDKDIAKELGIEEGFLMWYEVFGSSDIKNAKKQYKKWALKYHPDKITIPANKDFYTRVFQVISEAKGDRW